MKKLNSWLQDSQFTQPLSPACRMCAKGEKMVVLATGRCTTDCYYCPLSFRKKGSDRIFADEWELSSERDTDTLIAEARAINAKGAGITGGDPLVVWQRVSRYIRLLKNTFGDKFHIHLYTSGLVNTDALPIFVDDGLDEIRFHPLPGTWGNMVKSPLKPVLKALESYDVDLAVEVPVIPGTEKDLLSLISWADYQGIRWINLNELEFSEQNCNAFMKLGYDVKSDVSSAVQGSQETAYKVLEKAASQDYAIGVHYCSVSFKDRVQLRNRIKRRAKTIAKPYDVITSDGTLMKGVIESTRQPLRQTGAMLRRKYTVPTELMHIDADKNRIEIAAWILEKIAPDLDKNGYLCFLVEEYPTADRLEVERLSLPPHHIII
jgi:uncharacterized protein